MKINFEEKNGIMLIKLEGHVQYEDYSNLTSFMKKLFNDGKVNVVFDLASVVSISSSGWGIFIGSLKEFRTKGGDIVLACMNDATKHVYELLNMDGLIDVFDSVEEAMDAFSVG